MLLHIKSLDPDLFKIIESTLKQMGFSKVVDVFFFPPPPIPFRNKREATSILWSIKYITSWRVSDGKMIRGGAGKIGRSSPLCFHYTQYCGVVLMVSYLADNKESWMESKRFRMQYPQNLACSSKAGMSLGAAEEIESAQWGIEKKKSRISVSANLVY